MGESAALGQSKHWQHGDKLVEAACFVQVGSILQSKSSFPVRRMKVELPALGGHQENTARVCEAARAMFRLLLP